MQILKAQLQKKKSNHKLKISNVLISLQSVYEVEREARM